MEETEETPLEEALRELSEEEDNVEAQTDVISLGNLNLFCFVVSLFMFFFFFQNNRCQVNWKEEVNNLLK